MIHSDAKDIIPRTKALMIAFGWQGGTIHQIAELTGCDAHDLIYKPSIEYDNSNKAGWFAYRSNSLEFNQHLIEKFKGNLQFWIGVAGGVQTTIKLGQENTEEVFDKMNNTQKYIHAWFNAISANADKAYKPSIKLFASGEIRESNNISITWEQFEAIRQLLIDTSESE